MPNSGVMLVWIPCRLDRKRWRSPCNSSSFGSRADSSSSGSGGGGELGEGSLKKTCCLGKRDSNTGSIGGELLDCNCSCVLVFEVNCLGRGEKSLAESWRRATREGVFSMRSINLSENLAHVLRGGSRSEMRGRLAS